MKSVLVAAFCLSVGVTSLISPTKSLADDSGYRSIDAAAESAASTLMAQFSVDEAEVIALDGGVTINLGSKDGVFKGERMRVYRRRTPSLNRWVGEIAKVRISDVSEQTATLESIGPEEELAPIIEVGQVVRRELAIAVFPLTDLDTEVATADGKGFAEALTQALHGAKPPWWEIVERSKIADAEEELGLHQTGQVGEETAKRVGEKVGADIIVVGSLGTDGRILRASPRMVGVETGVWIKSATVEWQPPQPHKKTPTWQIILGLLGLWQLLGQGGDGGGPEAPAGFNVVIQ